jgi:hypothetical protein
MCVKPRALSGREADCLHRANVNGALNVFETVVGDFLGVLDIAIVIELKYILSFKYALPVVLARVHINVD